MQELRDSLRGELVLPGDDAYDEARSVWNGMIDRRPSLIVRCTGTSDVIAAVGFARSEGLTVAVRGGSHNVAGNATCDGGLVIDLSPMKGVRVDAESRTVRAQGGLTWGELDAETQGFGLATTGGLVTSTGVAGFTLGGGIGWLMRKHGLACDNLISADVVTADGQTVRASETENAELLWGLRGGGGNFGVVTEFEFRLHPVSQVLGGLLAWPAEAARDVLRFWRGWVRDTTDDLCTMAAFLYAPPEPFVPPEVHGMPIFAIACFHLDLEGSAEDDLRPLRDLGPAVDVVGPMPYAAIQGMFDAGAPRGSRNYWRSGYIDELTDGAIDAILAHTSGIPAPLGQVHIHQMGGAMSRVPAGATAFGNRDAGFLMNCIGLWLDPSEDQANTAWVRAASDAMESYGTGARYVNFLADEGDAGVRSAYEAETFTRLQNLKARYDPTNFFHLNQNIKPA
ncbi:MAG TPA: FAD-binding oxidoreductase [Solirubrobacteraceae bacterium]|nr:FAD-binding oxidoreductase [Solirubrobacteraceae bacterium]